MASVESKKGSSPAQTKSLVSTCKRFATNFQLKPLTKNNILFHYAPLVGAVSYTGLSVNVMNPSLVVRLLPKRDLTNILLAHTLVGTGLYIYNRPHLSVASRKDKIAFSTYGALMFTFGSVLVWAVTRSVLPESVAVCTAFGVGSSICLLKLGTDYMDLVDAQVASK